MSLFACLQPAMTVVLESVTRQSLPSFMELVGIGLVFMGIRLKVYVEHQTFTSPKFLGAQSP